MKLFYAITLFGFLKSSIVPETKYDFRVIHTNDIHAHLDQFNIFGTDCTEEQIQSKQCYGGAARQVSVIEQLRKEAPRSILLDAGDQFQGTFFFNYYGGSVISTVMNILNYDAMTIGNHEFDNGPKFLGDFFRSLRFPVVCSNIDVSNEPTLVNVVKPYTILPKYGGIGIVGYIVPETNFLSSPGPTVKFLDPATSVQKYVDELKAKGIQRIIAVSHNGYHQDIDVASKTKGISLIVGGHSHTYLSVDPKDKSSGGIYPTAVKNLDGESTYVVQAKCWGYYIGYLDIKFNDRGYISRLDGKPMLLSYDVPEEKVMRYRVDKWREPFGDYLDRVVGTALGDFDNSTCQRKECSIGDLIADAMLESRKEAGVSASIMNAGGIRAGILKGKVRVQDVTTVLPFGNSLVDVEVTGEFLKKTLEGIIVRINQNNGRVITSFVQFSGLKLVIDTSAPEFSKLKQAEIYDPATNSFEEISFDKTYKIVTIDYLASGGDNFFDPAFTNIVSLKKIDTVLEDYLEKYSPVEPKLDGRITFV